MNKNVLPTLLLIFAFFPNAFSQQEKPPSTPLIQVPPALAHWKILIAKIPSAEPAKAEKKREEEPSLVEIEIRKGPATAQMLQRWSHGKTSESWVAEGYLLNTYPALPDIYVTRLDLLPPGLKQDFASFHQGFPGCAWIEEKYFVATVKREGVSCHYYRNKAENREAWINADNRLPVAYRHDETLSTYAFLQAPRQAPVLPEKFKQELAIYQKADAQ